MNRPKIFDAIDEGGWPLPVILQITEDPDGRPVVLVLHNGGEAAS